MSEPKHYNYFVIGGGSGKILFIYINKIISILMIMVIGGIASARRAVMHGAKAAVAENSVIGGNIYFTWFKDEKQIFIL